MVEVVALVFSDLDSIDHLCHVFGVHANDKNVAVLLCWNKEAIRDMDGTLTKDVIGDDLDVVWPCEANIKFGRSEYADIAVRNSILNTTDDIDFARRHDAKARHKEEVLIAALKLAHVDKGGVLDIKFVVRGHFNVVLGGGHRRQGSSCKRFSEHLVFIINF